MLFFPDSENWLKGFIICCKAYRVIGAGKNQYENKTRFRAFAEKRLQNVFMRLPGMIGNILRTRPTLMRGNFL